MLLINIYIILKNSLRKFDQYLYPKFNYISIFWKKILLSSSIQEFAKILQNYNNNNNNNNNNRLAPWLNG